MPVRDTPESNPDFILALYQNPEDEVLLAEMALASSGPGLSQFSPSGADGLSRVEGAIGVPRRFKADPEDIE